MKFGQLLILVLLFQFQVYAQNPEIIRINVKRTPLNEVLLDLKEDYGFQFAFDKDLLSQYIVNFRKSFNSKNEAIEFLLRDFPLDVEMSGEVFLIIPHVGDDNTYTTKNDTRIGGQVLEAQTFEPLPFSYILINNKSIQSDQHGNFTFLATADTAFNLRISHLGYFIYDTLVTGNLFQRYMLTPRLTEIAEVQVEGNPVEQSTLIGDIPGKIKLNHRIAPILPGYGDNSVFNMLRLMPGILAAGEQSSDLLIWGSYESHSKILFDGFTIFGLKNFSDDIGVVNPLVLKDMEIYKGGYEAKYGDRVGGIVNIIGKNGSLQKPSFTFNINSTTVNSLLELPVSLKSSVLLAYRQTFYDLYNPADLQLFNRNSNSPVDVTLVPDYNFRDANFKYTFQDKNFSAELSLYGGGDRYAYYVDREIVNNIVSREEEEQNQQRGSSFLLNMVGKNGNSSTIKLAYSTLRNISEEVNKTTNKRTNKERILKLGTGENNVSQVTISEESRFNFRNGHYLEIGGGFESNNVLINRQLFSEDLINSDTRLQRFFFYVQDNLPVNSFLEFKAGLRANYVLGLNKFYPEPRLASSLKISEKVKLNISWGLYHQFLAKTTLVDSTYNYYYFWANANNETIPVLSGKHWVGGFSFNNNGLTASVEGYYKSTSGLSRYVNGTNTLARGFYNGEGRSYGIDFL